MERELGKHYVSADIGCHQFAALAPFDFGATSMGYGLGAAGAAALNVHGAKRRTISVMGDGGFWIYDGYVKPLPSEVGDFVFSDLNCPVAATAVEGHVSEKPPGL